MGVVLLATTQPWLWKRLFVTPHSPESQSETIALAPLPLPPYTVFVTFGLPSAGTIPKWRQQLVDNAVGMPGPVSTPCFRPGCLSARYIRRRAIAIHLNHVGSSVRP